MRPVDRGPAPNVYNDYEDAKPDLLTRLGYFCSYCERRIPTNLAVEHILPKDDNLPYAHLRNEWTNFLLACVNCNSAKRTKIIDFNTHLLPDRDNTFQAYLYEETGLVSVNPGINRGLRQMAKRTSDMVALNRCEHPNWDSKNLYSALERFGQRAEAWFLAKDARADYDKGEVNIRRICREAAMTGFFSIWMAAFDGIPDVLIELINTFPHTATDCFDPQGHSITPRPHNGLQSCGKL